MDYNIKFILSQVYFDGIKMDLTHCTAGDALVVCEM